MKKILTLLIVTALLSSCSNMSKKQKAVVAGAAAVAVVAVLANKKSNTQGVSSQVSEAITNNVITVGVCSNHAGAICSLRWNGKEFIDDYDHGRLLQSASSLDQHGEIENPTAGGGEARDNTSQLLSLTKSPDGKTLKTLVQMAYWRAFKGKQLSSHRLRSQFTTGYRNFKNVLEYQTTFELPSSENHWYAVFESLTAYLPRDFNAFWKYQGGQIMPYRITPDDMKEQRQPIIAATQDGRFAMALWSPDLPQYGLGFGASILNGNVPKLNNVFRVTNPSGSYEFRHFVVVGSLEDARRTMHQMGVR